MRSPTAHQLQRNILIAIILLMWLLVFASVASAQTPVRDFTTATMQGLDVYTTRVVLSQGGKELNGAMKPLAGSTIKLGAAKAGVAALTIYSTRKLHKSGRKKTAFALWAGVNLLQGVVVYHNMKQVKR